MWNVSVTATSSIFRGRRAYDEDEIKGLSVVWLAQHDIDGPGRNAGQETDGILYPLQSLRICQQEKPLQVAHAVVLEPHEQPYCPHEKGKEIPYLWTRVLSRRWTL